MLYRETSDGFVPWNGELIGNVRHPRTIEALWTAEQLAEIGLFVPIDPGIPAGKRVVSESVERVSGEVVRVYVLEDVVLTTDEQYPPLQPWQFWAVIDLSGVGEAALYGAIDLVPDEEFKVKARRKLANPPGGVFRRSDPLFSNSFLMMQLGLTKAQIDGLWTQALALT